MHSLYRQGFLRQFALHALPAVGKIVGSLFRAFRKASANKGCLKDCIDRNAPFHVDNSPRVAKSTSVLKRQRVSAVAHRRAGETEG